MQMHTMTAESTCGLLLPAANWEANLTLILIASVLIFFHSGTY